MPNRAHTSTIAQAFREIDAARARAAESRTSIAMLIAPTPRGTTLSLDPSEPSASRRLPARQAWLSRLAAGWRA
jgi:hypothetical protein